MLHLRRRFLTLQLKQKHASLRAASSNVVVERLAVGGGGGVGIDGVAHMKLNRVVGKNAFSAQMLSEFNLAVAEVQADSSIKALIVSSTVPKVFCAGADLKERAAMAENEVEAFVDQLRGAFSALEALPMPTIAAIEGVALGGGLELAMACDFRVAGAEALLGLPETSLAIIPGAGGTQRLPRLVGVAKAKELIFLAKKLSAEAAGKAGLVTEVVEAGHALARAQELAALLCRQGPIALRMAKKAIYHGMQVDLATGLEIEKACYSQVVPTEDRREGLKAFVERRDPVYVGK